MAGTDTSLLDGSGFCIEATGLTKQYGPHRGIVDASLAINSGEIVGVLGTNGAGKTTLVKLLCGLVPQDRGTLTILGRTWDHDGAAIRSSLGYCPQECTIWPNASSFEQLVFMARLLDVPRSVAERRAEDLLDRFGIPEMRDTRPSELSGGMKRLLNIALALVHQPDVLVFDEPFSELDPMHRATVRALIEDHARRDGKCALVTSNVTGDIDRLADRVAVINRSEVVACAPPGDLAARYGDGAAAHPKRGHTRGGHGDAIQAEASLESAFIELASRGRSL